MANSTLESDDAFARRLQAQEMGIMQPHSGIDAQTPLMLDGRNPVGNQNRVIGANNNRVDDASTARATVCAILTVYTPQILAAIIILSLHWDDTNVCDQGHSVRWKYWAALSTVRMFCYALLVVINHVFKAWLDARPNEQTFMTNASHLVDAFGLLWFIVGNMWLFGDDESGCKNPGRSPVYNLCVCMLVINYIQICLPCIIAILMIPVFCFCMPCLIRVLARLHDPQANQGATDEIIANLPVIIIDSSHLRQGSEDNSCPICLNEMVIGEEARLLSCDHLFHKQCVDEWLRVNATCPTCRKSILPSTQNNSNSDHSANNNMINITSGDRAGQRLITLNFDLTGGAGNNTNG